MAFYSQTHTQEVMVKVDLRRNLIADTGDRREGKVSKLGGENRKTEFSGCEYLGF